MKIIETFSELRCLNSYNEFILVYREYSLYKVYVLYIVIHVILSILELVVRHCFLIHPSIISLIRVSGMTGVPFSYTRIAFRIKRKSDTQP